MRERSLTPRQLYQLWYIFASVSIGDARLQVIIFRSKPVSHKKAVGEDIKTLQFG